MAQKRDSKGRFTKANDSLASFMTSLSGYEGLGGGYRDSPLSGYGKDAQFGFTGIYQTSWLAAAAVDRIPADCFKKGYRWEAEADQVNLIEAIERRHKVKKKKEQALKLSRLDGEAYIYMDNGQRPDTPLNVDIVGQRNKLRFINVLRKSEVSKGEKITDPLSEYYGEPGVYRISGVDIHPSRIIRFVNDVDPDTNEGNSVLRRLIAPIVAAETARDNTVALTTEARIDIMKVCGLMDAVSDPETESQLVKRYSLIRQGKATNKMIVIDKENEDYDQKSAEFTTLPDVIETMRREVAAAIEVPYALLFGRSGGLGSNSESDILTYYDTVKTIQTADIQQVCEPLDEMVIRSALGSRPEEIYLEWLPLKELTEKEAADIANTTADAISKLVNAQVIPAEVMTESVIASLAEIGALPGIEQAYNDWINPPKREGQGGDLDAPDDDDMV